jgi:hypothetical protein
VRVAVLGTGTIGAVEGGHGDEDMAAAVEAVRG